MAFLLAKIQYGYTGISPVINPQILAQTWSIQVWHSCSYGYSPLFQESYITIAPEL